MRAAGRKSFETSMVENELELKRYFALSIGFVLAPQISFHLVTSIKTGGGVLQSMFPYADNPCFAMFSCVLRRFRPSERATNGLHNFPPKFHNDCFYSHT